MRFSIIIPVYNSAEYLPKCLESTCGQVHKDFEVICINDGSTDNSLTVLEEHQKVYQNLVIYTQKNAGPSAARNKRLEMAQGEYILFCDSDDWFERNTVLSELDLYIKQQDQVVDVVYFPGNTNWGGNTVPAVGFRARQYQTGLELLSKTCLDLRGTYLFFGAIYAYAYRRELINQHKLQFNTDLSFREDCLWCLSCMTNSKYCIVYPYSCYFYNVRANSIMTSNSLKDKRLRDNMLFADIAINQFFNVKSITIKRYLSLQYLSAINSQISAGNTPTLRHKIKLLYSIHSIKSFIKLLALYISPKLYKSLLKL